MGRRLIGLVVVAAVRFYREGLAGLFADRNGFAVAATAAAGEDGVAAVRAHAPDVVLVAVGPGEGPDLVRNLAAAAPGAQIVALGVAEDDAEVLALAEAGVAGYVTTDGSADDVVDVVESVARGETVCSPRIAALLLRRVARLAREPGARPEVALTARERQIVALIDEGLSNKEIARALSIEIATVKNHVHNILEKLRVKRRGEAAAVLRRS